MGGVEKVKRQRDQGRLTVRERIDALVDPTSFHEIGAVSGTGEYDEKGELKQLTPANCVFGRARIDGRTIVVVGDDFTVRGGSADASISAKPLMAEEMAHDFRLPIIRIIEGSGGGGSVKTIETKGAANLPGGIGGNRWYRYTTENLAHVPVVGLGLGSVAGLGAARLAASHYSVMTRASAMFVAGPPVVKRLGQDLSKQELGGAETGNRTEAEAHHRDPGHVFRREAIELGPADAAGEIGRAAGFDGLDRAAAAGALDDADDRQAEIVRHFLRHQRLGRDRGIGRAAAHREIVADDDDGASIDPRPPEHAIGRRQLLQLAIFVIFADAGDRADFVEALGIDQPVDTLADREAALVALSLDLLNASHLVRERLAPSELVEFGLPVHSVPPSWPSCFSWS